MSLSRLRIIKNIIEEYNGTIPFHHYLKSVFTKNKSFGSRDRRIYRSWCYSWFRLGNAIKDFDFNTRIFIGYYLTNGFNDDLSIEIGTSLNLYDKLNSDSDSIKVRVSKIKNLYEDFKLEDIFPSGSLSDGILKEDLLLSMFSQPHVFIKVSNKKEMHVLKECSERNILYEKTDIPGCVSFTPATDLMKLPSWQTGYFEIRDRSSQLAGNAIPAQPGESWWDCCCGAGGKSLQLSEMISDIHITATDKRESVLKNFEERIKRSGKKNIKLKAADLENALPEKFFNQQFDGIIADVPCSGSGTWSRTPEMLTFFKSEQIEEFVKMQKVIISNALPFLKPGGKLIYITCSVFRLENEEMAGWIQGLPGMKMLEQKFLNGIETYSDSMFYAICEIDQQF